MNLNNVKLHKTISKRNLEIEEWSVFLVHIQQARVFQMGNGMDFSPAYLVLTQLFIQLPGK